MQKAYRETSKKQPRPRLRTPDALILATSLIYAEIDTVIGGDIRIVIPGISVSRTEPVPGQGCPMFRDATGKYNGENDGRSWSNGPDELARNRSCQYNLNCSLAKIG